MKTVKVWERIYDNPKAEDGSDKPNKLLGEFRVLEQLIEDSYAEQFIGESGGKVYLVDGKEVSFHNGGTRYTVTELKSLAPKPIKGEKVEVIERFERGKGSTYSVDGGETFHPKSRFEGEA